MTASRVGGLLLRGVRHPLAALLWSVLLIVVLIALAFAALRALGLQQASGHLQFGSLAQALVATLALVIVARVVERQPPSNVGLSPRKAPRDLGLGAIAGVGLMALVVGILALAGAYRATWNPLSGHTDTLLATLVLLAFAAYTEEVLFRAILFRHLESWAGSGPALVLSSLLFGAVHLGNPNASWLAALAIALEAGILLGAVWMLTRSLWAVWTLHLGWNWAQGSLFGLSVSGLEVRGVLHGTLTGDPLWTGGDFGPEAGLVAILIAGTAGGLVLARAIRTGCWRPNPWRPRWRFWERSRA